MSREPPAAAERAVPQRLLDAVPLLVVSCDCKSRYTHANRAELTVPYSDPRIQTIRVVLTPARDAAGAVVGWDGVGEEIPVRHR